MMTIKQVEKVIDWLNQRCEYLVSEVQVRRGYAEFVAYIFRLRRKGKPSVYYILDVYNRTLKRGMMY